MPSDFAGSTAEHYLRFRRDLPGGVLDDLVRRVDATQDSVAVDLGAGTGQVAAPLAARVGTVLAMEPEPAMAALLRRRTEEQRIGNLLTLLASDRDLPTVVRALGGGAWRLVTIENALHWMDADAVFRACSGLLPDGGGLAIITHGVPLWLGPAEWARSLRRFLEEWLGQPVSSPCGSDDATRRDREQHLRRTGFSDVVVIRHRYECAVDAEHVVGHLYSAMSEAMVPGDRRAEFEAGVRQSLGPFDDAPMVEEVPVTVLLARR
jgi:SAM-dependent methyltransferase